MNTLPPLTDRQALTRNRVRAAAAPALFLHEALVSEVQDRLAEVNREFTAPAVVTGWPEVWRGNLPQARIVPDAETLDLAVQGHDLAIHALALHWADDPIGQLVQCRRALRPDGLLIAALFGGQTLNELRSCLAQAEAAATGGLSPRVLPMGEIRDLGGLLHRAGLALPVADSLPLTVRYETPLHLMRDLRAMGEQNALYARLRHPSRRTVLLEAMRLYAERHTGADGRITATFEIVTLTGWAPDDSQPVPLRPGSATHSLAKALGTSETRLPPRDD
ncbi:methyltransferase domain-containing protein [Roseisalinus antarcticus]|uniref:Methyltransferase type 11 domain-containing protein n=1 Tax=Roseisalinus antarcticus TaxID=254357 RepID=A0A1Y5S543_9RHOB|nr:methyltransferase domain-containing protein [Roseisalinus antarcticus]SLN32775.1 hypothetical protein ROA7023_01143 [Roseisalinus antarcticus]